MIEHPDLFETRKHIEKSETVTNGIAREIRAGKERTLFGIHDDSKGPAAVSSQCLAHIHAHRINVWTFLTVYLDAYEVVVQILSNRVVFE